MKPPVQRAASSRTPGLTAVSADVPLIGLAHGSRHPGVTGSVDALMAAVARRGGMPTAAAYLDLTDPDLPTAVAALADRGFRRMVVAPLLFTRAFHATVDVPQSAAEAASASGIELATADILGTGDDILSILLDSLRDAGIGDDAAVLLFSVGSSDEAANAAVHDLAARLGACRTGAVRAAFGTRNPRPEEVAAELPQPMAILPLFISPGLLLDPLLRRASKQGLAVAPPLGERVAPLLLQRYRTALGG
jgi:sirohydrochlorin cobaltochelatase